MADRNFKTWRVSLPEDSPVLSDLFEYGREMGTPPGETTRIILTEWSRAMRGRNPFGATMMPQMMSAPQAPIETPKPKESPTDVERERAKSRGKRFATRTLGLDDD
jgi:hypothetical protein